MRLIDLNIQEFVNEVDSTSPAPGGGSVSALASTLGVSLSRMVSHLTIGKKKYSTLDETIKVNYEEKFAALKEIKDELITLIDKDTEAFNKIMAAFKLPKETDEEKQMRKEAIETATMEAIEVPYAIACLSSNALTLIASMVEYGNQNAITDIGVGTLLVYTGLEGAILNVKINLTGLSNEEDIMKYKNSCEDLLEEGKKIKESILSHVHSAIA